MNHYIKALFKNLKIPLISVILIIVLMAYTLSGALYPMLNLMVLGVFETIPRLEPMGLGGMPNLLSSLFIALLFVSPLWSFAIWKVVMPSRKIGLLPASLGLLLVLLGVLFVYYIYVPLIFKYILVFSTDNIYYYSLALARDLVLKSFVSFIFVFQIFPITLHFRKNYERSLWHSIFVRVLLLLMSISFTTLFTPPDVLSTLLFVLPVMILFELARAIRRWVVIEDGSFYLVK